MKSFALSLAFIVRFTATRKWPIGIIVNLVEVTLSDAFFAVARRKSLFLNKSSLMCKSVRGRAGRMIL